LIGLGDQGAPIARAIAEGGYPLQLHLRELALVDMRQFSGAVEPLGDQASPVVARAIAGAQGLPELTALIEPEL
jgi:3-hydroxyisobutyrate dehydrogenase-like beta-hydroxyacid dehydrogenase